MRAKLTHRLFGREGKLLYADALPAVVNATRCEMVEALWPVHGGANAIVRCAGLQYLAHLATLPPFRQVRLHTVGPLRDPPAATLYLTRAGQPLPLAGEFTGEGAELAREYAADARMLGVLLDWLTDNAERVAGLPAGDVRQAAEEVRRFGRFFDAPPARARKRRAAP